MNPFFFGDSANPLYGVYHPPNAQPSRKEGVLLCPPFGQEYMRSHRAYRQLALLLSKQGFPVLRFDYQGTGDSFGEPYETTVEKWLEDLNTAATELQQTAQVSIISIVGLRLGGLLSAQACIDRVQVNKLILWDTIVSGKRYLEELGFEISKDSRSKFIDQNGTLHFNGFPLTHDQLDEIKAIDLEKLKPNANDIYQICSSENDNQNCLKNSWSKLNNFHYQYTPSPGDWNFVDDFGGILLPQKIIQSIVTSMQDSQGNER